MIPNSNIGRLVAFNTFVACLPGDKGAKDVLPPTLGAIALRLLLSIGLGGIIGLCSGSYLAYLIAWLK